MATFTALIFKDEGTNFGVLFPDLPGLCTGGETIEKAITNAHEGGRAHVAFMQREGDEIPEPRSMEELLSDPENLESLVVAFPVPIPVKGKAVRVTMTIDENLLRQIDTFAKDQGYTRSALVAEACRRVLAA